MDLHENCGFEIELPSFGERYRIFRVKRLGVDTLKLDRG